MARWDAIVIGLGGVGSAAAFHLADQGLRVLGLDQYPAVHDHGSSHGMTRIIRQAYFEHPSYVPMLRRAYALWDDLEQATDQTLFHRTGLVELGPADGVVIPGVLNSAAEHDLDVESLSANEVTARWPGLVVQPDWRAVIERDAGYLRVEACVEAHLRRARERSATLRHGQTVRRWTAVGRGVEVTTDSGVDQADRLVIACGPWSGPLLGSLGIPLRVLRKHQYWYRPAGHGFAEEDGFPCFFFETPSGYFYGFPSVEGAGVKVARHSGGTEIAEPTATHPPDGQDRDLVERFLGQCLPGVGNQLRTQAGCYYTMTPDEHFLVDSHPEHRHVVVVAGLSGHGFKFTSVLGELASQIATGRSTSLDTSLLRIERERCSP